MLLWNRVIYLFFLYATELHSASIWFSDEKSNLGGGGESIETGAALSPHLNGLRSE